MQDQKTTILEAAVRVFMRFGVGRTRMHDIAAEAGVVRQTIYLSFKNKDEILCASIHHYSELSLSEIHAEWAQLDGLEDKLDVFYEHAIISSFEMINASQEARDMIGGYNAAGKAATKQAQKRKIKAWKQCLEEHHLPKNSNITSDQLAEYIVLASIGLRDMASSKGQLKDLLDVQNQTILSWLG